MQAAKENLLTDEMMILQKFLGILKKNKIRKTDPIRVQHRNLAV